MNSRTFALVFVAVAAAVHGAPVSDASGPQPSGGFPAMPSVLPPCAVPSGSGVPPFAMPSAGVARRQEDGSFAPSGSFPAAFPDASGFPGAAPCDPSALMDQLPSDAVSFDGAFPSAFPSDIPFSVAFAEPSASGFVRRQASAPANSAAPTGSSAPSLSVSFEGAAPSASASAGGFGGFASPGSGGFSGSYGSVSFSGSFPAPSGGAGFAGAPGSGPKTSGVPSAPVAAPSASASADAGSN
ncbi:uncharacterized protein SCHCODRAFT_02511448 [Schizophyllum commune H4-8]|uniref:Uncharacterized protein n=1 Tax=Schizophyllum commune (strain H4-8 / FGSC 9210) TaxID=578458 RepID=D8QBR5_SCHCM|nr:uncharacterized protein SCHCODRAFT_02511448 [Schizophyllum commune H4-8]KAI5889283.1 hypothetical protein SCHCODRAFT_02511448 [Schizophyllum commune H4-8]